ncbi:MAG TPA: SAM-dependent methyltransferase [Methanoregulaceae archaeon]|nr:SAM-dependent methyltransferase [Methanoregulaceae archaeon]
MNTRIVALENLNSALQEDWVDRKRKPYVCGTKAYIPVKEGHPFQVSLPPRRPYTGRGYHMIGPMAILHGRRPSHAEVETLMRWCRPRGILWIKSYTGVKRIPDAELIAGKGGEVLHRENGISFWLDPARVMFAQGNREEKARMKKIIGKGERVADMCAGIGYFSIPAALSGAKVHAMDLNRVAFGYLERNILENGVESSVFAQCGDCRDLLQGSYDRFIIGHYDSIMMLPTALEHAHEDSILHVHSSGITTPDIGSLIRRAGFYADIQTRRVKKTGPGQWHYVQDVVLS